MTCAALARLFRHITSIGTEPGVEAEVTTADAQVQLFSKLIPVVKEREGRQASRQAERERERERERNPPWPIILIHNQENTKGPCDILISSAQISKLNTSANWQGHRALGKAGNWKLTHPWWK